MASTARTQPRSLTPTFVLLGVLTSLLATPAASQEAEGADVSAAAPAMSDIEILRTATRVLFGLGVVGGTTAFASNPLVLETDMGQTPSVLVGLRVWPEEYAGFQLVYQGGFFGGLEVSQLQTVAGSATLGLTHHRLEGDFRYRAFTSPRPDAIELSARLGFVMNRLSPTDHSPTLVLSTTWFGPELGGAVKVPFAEGNLGVELEVDAILPFFVREAPVSSGVPDSAFGYHVGLAPYYRLLDTVFLGLRVDVRSFSADFAGQGERFGGVTDASNDELYTSAQLEAEWAL